MSRRVWRETCKYTVGLEFWKAWVLKARREGNLNFALQGGIGAGDWVPSQVCPVGRRVVCRVASWPSCGCADHRLDRNDP
jgi:hypothetical protein